MTQSLAMDRWMDEWGDGTVVSTTVKGHPGLAYLSRPSRITAALTASRRWSDRPYLIQGNRVVTFAEHEQQVAAVAHRLVAMGVRDRDRVAIFAANSPDWVATFYAVISIGAVAVPCNGWWSAEELAHAITSVEPNVLICDQRRQSRVPQNVRSLLIEDLTDKRSMTTWTEPPAFGRDPDQDGSEDDPAVILFTAGTTSSPKGAVLSHRSLVANLQTLLTVSRKLPRQVPDDLRPSVTLVGLPLFHIGAIQLILVPLMTGSQIVFLEGKFDAPEVLRLIEERKVTMFSGVPTMMNRLLAEPAVDARDLTSLRTVVLGGSPVDDDLLARVREAFPSTVRGVGQTYGLTEAGGVVSTGVGRQIAANPGSAGKIAPVVEVKIQRPDAFGRGTVLVRSPAVMDGYWRERPEESIDRDGWFDTGDIGWVNDDQYLFITGRAKDVIIRGGENVSPARVEAVLLSHELVSEVAVVGLPDEDLGEVIGAVVVFRERGQDATHLQATLTDYAKERLGHFEVPSQWWFRTEGLPINDAGKVLKQQLKLQWIKEASR